MYQPNLFLFLHLDQNDESVQSNKKLSESIIYRCENKISETTSG